MHLKFLRVAVLAALPVLPLSAQSGGGDGYLFSAPHATLSIRGGLARPTASSDVFSFVKLLFPNADTKCFVVVAKRLVLF